MKVKEQIAGLLEEHQGEFLSGEQIASMLGITRSAVWKAINSLKDDGYTIKALTNKGYCLSEESDILSKSGIEKFLGEDGKKYDLCVLKTVDSTNTVVKEKAATGAPEGTVVISSQQTEGRGRFTRKFYSPPDSGIYMSILLRPVMSAAEATLITTAAAVAVSDTVEKLSGRNTGIKWVNDVLINNKKICGILTEASLNMESGDLEYAIVGIGLNVYEPDGGFPEKIKDIAGAVFNKHKSDIRNQLAAEIIKTFFNYYYTLKQKEYISTYRKRCIVFGKRILVIHNGIGIPATAIDIDSDCRLLVKYDSGVKEYLSHGEISIKI